MGPCVVTAPCMESRGLFPWLQGTPGLRAPLEPRERALGVKEDLAACLRGQRAQPETRGQSKSPTSYGTRAEQGKGGVTKGAGDWFSLWAQQPCKPQSPKGWTSPPATHMSGPSVTCPHSANTGQMRVSHRLPGWLAGTGWLRAHLSYCWKESSRQTHALVAGPCRP